MRSSTPRRPCFKSGSPPTSRSCSGDDYVAMSSRACAICTRMSSDGTTSKRPTSSRTADDLRVISPEHGSTVDYGGTASSIADAGLKQAVAKYYVRRRLCSLRCTAPMSGSSVVPSACPLTVNQRSRLCADSDVRIDRSSCSTLFSRRRSEALAQVRLLGGSDCEP